MCGGGLHTFTNQFQDQDQSAIWKNGMIQCTNVSISNMYKCGIKCNIYVFLIAPFFAKKWSSAWMLLITHSGLNGKHRDCRGKEAWALSNYIHREGTPLQPSSPMHLCGWALCVIKSRCILLTVSLSDYPGLTNSDMHWLQGNWQQHTADFTSQSQVWKSHHALSLTGMQM